MEAKIFSDGEMELVYKMLESKQTVENKIADAKKKAT
jgi:hypothetical protein